MVMEQKVERFASIRAAMSVGFAPIHYLVSRPIQLIDHLGDQIHSHQSLVAENRQLKTEQILLNTQLQRMIAVESENNYLKSLFKFSSKIKQKTEIAELLAVSSEPYVHQVVLDKGKNEHVYVGQPVLDANGVMGQVIEVSALTSRVLLINDPSSGIAVQNGRNNLRAVAAGDPENSKLSLLYLPLTADVRIGDTFITSGLGDRYPAGYPVGVVAQVDKDPSRQFAKIILEPAAHLNSSRQVLLLWASRHA